MRSIFCALSLALVLCRGLHAAGNVDAAWRYLAENNHTLAEQAFLQALAADSSDKRAYLGLSYLYELQEQYAKAWGQVQKFVEIEENYSPYVFAAGLTPKVAFNYDKGAIDLFKTTIDREGCEPMLKASLCGIVGNYLQEHNQLDEAKTYFSKIQAVTDWLLIGPFDNTSASGFNNTFPPEREFAASAKYKGKNGIVVEWFPIVEMRQDLWVDFTRYFSYTISVFYGNTFVYSPEKRTAQIRVGTSGSLKAFLNDEPVLSSIDENNNDTDTYIAETELQQGWNRLLIKTGYSEIARCNFMVRITDSVGNPLPDIQISTETKSYPKKPGAPVKSIPNFVETYFEQQIENEPAHLENYLLLADCYMRNDKAIEAELTLRKALSQSPQNALILFHFIEAYARGEKFDEIASTMEKLSSLAPNLPAVIEYKLTTAFKNIDLEKAEALIKQYAGILPDTDKLRSFEIQLYSAKSIPEKIIAATHTAYEKSPKNWDFVQAEALLTTFTTKKYDKAIEILSDYLKHTTTTAVFTTLAEYQLKASDLTGWKATYDRLLEFYPASTGFYYQMANTYLALQDYKSAEEFMHKTMALCPNSALYWGKLAEIQRATDRTDEAKRSYETALNFSPTYYEARDMLRELQKKPPVFSDFPQLHIDSLITNAPSAADYPDNAAVILLSDARRVVYERGASESSEEFLAKVLNSDGVEDFKEYWLSYNAYTEQLIMEKAVVIKKDGTEVQADNDQGHIVFKSLEENDAVYLKWRLRSFYSGKLSEHFWDEHGFNDYYPLKEVRYSILVPKEIEYHIKTQNMSDKPALRKQTGDGVLYLWRLADEPAVVYEYEMPGLTDVGKRLYISSINSWEYLVDWYADLAQTKTRDSYEIKAIVNQLFADKNDLSESEKIRTIYDFVTDDIYYSSVSFRQSGLVPQKARDVLVNKIGDCKDKATLAIAMLAEVGIKSHYVLVNTRDEGLNQNVPPSIAFNHAIVGIDTKSGTQYLDLTAQNYPFGSIPHDDLEAFALEIKPGTKAPFHIKQDPFIKSTVLRKTRVKLSDDLSMFVSKFNSRFGASSAYTRAEYRFKGENERKQRLNESLAQDYPNVKLTRLEFDNMDALSPALNYEYDFAAPNYVNEAGSFLMLRLPWSDNLSLTKALSYEQRKYPYNYWPAADTLREEMQVEMPSGYQPLEVPAPMQFECPIAAFAMQFSFEDGRLNCHRKFVNKKSTVTPEEYQAFKEFYNKVVKADDRQILLKRVE